MLLIVDADVDRRVDAVMATAPAYRGGADAWTTVVLTCIDVFAAGPGAAVAAAGAGAGDVEEVPAFVVGPCVGAVAAVKVLFFLE